MLSTLSVLLLFCTFFMVLAGKQSTLLRFFGLQSLLVSGIVFLIGNAEGMMHLIGASIFFMLIYAVGIPALIGFTIRRRSRSLLVGSSVSRGTSLLCSLGLTLVGYYVIPADYLTNRLENTALLPIAISTSLIGCLLIATRTDRFSQLTGLLSLTHAICLAEMVLIRSMSNLIEISIYLYLFFGILLGIALSQRLTRNLTVD